MTSWRSVLASCFFVFMSVAGASAGTIVQYDTEGITTTETASQVDAINPAAGVTGIAVTRGAGLTASSASFSINASGWNDLAADDYYQFGFTTTIPYEVQQFTVGLRSSNTGPGFVDLLYSKDGGAFTSLASTNPIKLVGTTFNDLAADLSEIGVVTSSLVFRFVVDPSQATSAGFNADSSSNPAIGAAGTFRFASYSPPSGEFLDPEITGQAVPVPEPSGVILAALGAVVVGTATLRGRRRPLA
jgi:hypothetical protein